MGTLDRRPAQKELLRLIVDYESADDFLTDYEQNLTANTAFMETSRTVVVGTIIEIGLAFPGLIQPIVLDALVQNAHAGGLTIALLGGSGPSSRRPPSASSKKIRR